MENKSEEIEDLMVRYLDGSAAAEEKEFLLRWIEASEEHRQSFCRMREVWLASEAALSSECETESAWQRFRTRADSFTPPRPRFINLNPYRWYQTAAVILLLISLGYGLSFLIPFSSKKSETVQYELITAKGSKGQFTLPDSSTVWLNAESKLIYSNTFNEKARTVRLEGEAYFIVAENKDKPFIVQAGSMTVEALGTSFFVSNQASGGQIKTVLLTGKVKITQPYSSQPVFLSPSDKLTFDKTSHKEEIVHLRHDHTSPKAETDGKKIPQTESASTKASLYVDWTKELLTFDNSSLSDIIVSLNGWYNVEIECPKAFADNTRLTFTVRRESINEILQAISRIVPIQYRMEENRIQLTPK